MKFVTWNVNSLNARLAFVLEWVAANSPEILCLQETKLKEDEFPVEAFEELGYFSAHSGQGRWNGVAIVSKTQPESVTKGAITEEFELHKEARHISGSSKSRSTHRQLRLDRLEKRPAQKILLFQQMHGTKAGRRRTC